MWRVWEEVDDSAAAAEPFTKPTMDFTVMSYNVLAQDMLEANQELYTHCPLEVLEWSYRCSLLLEEIQKWGPDVSEDKHNICLCFMHRCKLDFNRNPSVLLCADSVSPRSSGEPLPGTAASSPVSDG